MVIQVVVLVLENSHGDVLLTLRQKHQHLAGYWEFPGGKIEPNESAMDALRRECIEEINHHVTGAKQILEINHSYQTKQVKLLVFHEISNNPIIEPQENQSMQWVSKSDLNQHQLPEANQIIIQYLQNH